MPLIRITLTMCGWKSPESPVGMSHAKVTNIFAGQAPGRLAFEASVDVALPQIYRLHEMHIAIENSETVFRHSLTPSVQILSIYINRPRSVNAIPCNTRSHFDNAQGEGVLHSCHSNTPFMLSVSKHEVSFSARAQMKLDMVLIARLSWIGVIC